MLSLGWFITGPFIYIAVLVFVSVTAYTVVGYAKMPRHLRWDLYPVPHQGPEGSKYQKVDYSKMPTHRSILHEMKEMALEMLFIKKVFIHNPKLWKGSFPLHAGLYLCGLWLTCLTLGAGIAAADFSDINNAETAFEDAMEYMAMSSGVVGLTSGLIGSLLLLWQRHTDEDLRNMSDFVSYFNLYLMALLFGSGFAAWLFADPAFAILKQQIMTLLVFSPGSIDQPLIIIQFLIFGTFLLLLPFSRMLHFAVKYFFYHNIMWDDEMMQSVGKMEQDISCYLRYKVSWSADHVRTRASWNGQVVKGKEEPE